ncbi:riboflavin biosynthesis protein RibF [Akkermansiaceae bacterium]|nr:riboflavin biosynthesis protein RibF [Akkermansiaceae bacterium]MDB4356844.1 riboflavin biosynthesis protein RibF [Akkermansiaceae bacterium]MDB4522482.1 riboflavin biosynthesis protein RibF [bacterium]
MQTYRGLSEMALRESDFGLALGVFDGLHLGHQAVIDVARGSARTGLLTFDPHPVQVLALDRAPRRILTSLAHQELILESLGVDFLCVVEFTREFAAIPAEDFAKDLVESGAQRFAAGHDWTFGKGRGGDVEKLAQWVSPIPVTVVEPVLHEGKRISSTLIRQALAADDLATAAAFLGRPYSVFGEVKQGRQLGRQLGFPTANVDVAQEQLPPNGVYLIKARWQGEWVKGVANVGVRPTVDDSSRRSLEAHLFSDDVPDSYGWEVEVGFIEKIREEKKFSGIDELKAQIDRDIQSAKMRF